MNTHTILLYPVFPVVHREAMSKEEVGSPPPTQPVTLNLHTQSQVIKCEHEHSLMLCRKVINSNH